jgi:hypothetical protein
MRVITIVPVFINGCDITITIGLGSGRPTIWIMGDLRFKVITGLVRLNTGAGMTD